MRKALSRVVGYPRIVLIGILLVALPFLFRAPDVKTVDNVDYFTLDGNPAIEFYEHLKEVFGNDEFFVIAFKKETIFTRENLSLLKRITEEIETLDEVRKVKSLANIDDTIGAESYFEVRKFLEEIPDSPQDLTQLREEALNNPLYVNNFISRDGKTAAILVFTQNKNEDEGYRKVLIEKCKRILDHSQQGNDGAKETDFWLSGWTTTNLYLSQYLKKDISIFIPLTYVFITLCVQFIFGNWRLTLFALANISICVGSTMGLFYYADIRMNNVTSIVPPLIMALALCDTVHIFAHLEKNILARFRDQSKAVLHVLHTVFTPCLLTTLTTAIGFLSLYITDIPPIRDFALMASAGMVFELLFSFTLLPPLILFSPSDKIFVQYGEKKWLPKALNGIHTAARRYSKPIVISGAFLVLLSIWLGAGIRVETNLLEFFKKDSPVRQSLSRIEKELSGIGTLDISIRSKESEGFKIPENVKTIGRIQAFLREMDGIDSVNSFADFIKDINQSFHNEDPAFYIIPDSKELIAQYMLLYDSEDIEDFINPDFDHVRISARTHVYNSGAQRKMIRQIQEYISTFDPQGLEIQVSGRAVQDVTVIDALVRGQVISLGLAAAIIFLVLLAVLRSFKTWFVSMIPNLFPIAMNFGIMGAFDIPLDTATSLISAVALGIAVDDTIHFLYEYKRQRESGRDIHQALDRVITRKGRAILTSSCILAIGFGVMVFSNFMPIVSFGLLSAVIMITAVIGDLVLMPAVLYLGADPN